MLAEPAAPLPQVAAADARHHGGHHLPVIQAGEVLCHCLPGGRVRQIGFFQKLMQKCLPHLRGGQGIDHQVDEVHHLHPGVPETLGKGVVLRLGLFQIGDIVKQQPFQIFRHEVFQLLTGPVQQDLPQLADLRGVMDACFHAITPFSSYDIRVPCFLRFIHKKIAAERKSGYDTGKGCDTHEALCDRRRSGDPDL